MHLRPNLPKPDKLRIRLNAPVKHYLTTKVFSHKKVIAPVSSESDILAASASHKPIPKVSTTHENLKALASSQANHSPSGPYYPATHANKQPHLIPGAAARTDSQIKLLFSLSNLDDKHRRIRRWITFIAHVLFWSAAYYVLFL